jgi:hypothetical protein
MRQGIGKASVDIGCKPIFEEKLLSFQYRCITADPVALIQPGSWPNFQVLDLDNTYYNNDPLGAVKGLMNLTSLKNISMNK